MDQEQSDIFRRIYEEEMQLEVMRMEMKKKYADSEGKESASESNKVNYQNWLFRSSRVQPWIGSAFGTNSKQR